MTYKVLTQEEQDEIVVEFMKAQERDEFTHSLNLERFEQMLSTMPECTWKQRIVQLKDETQVRLNEVQSILKATALQMPPADRLEKAKLRMKAKEEKGG